MTGDPLVDRLVDALPRRGPAPTGRGPATGTAARVVTGVLSRYAEPHRHYHTREHLEQMVAAVDRLTAADPDPAVLCALLWHDAIYDPTAADNEQRSAALAAGDLRRVAGPGSGPPAAQALIHEVVRLIELTVHHRAAPGDTAGGVLCDADLAILAAEPERYADYTRRIRREYAHLDDDAFRRGRRAVLRRLLAAPALYATELGRREWESAARANLSAEAAGLAGQQAPTS